MNTLLRIAFLLVSAAILAPEARATVVGTGLVYQPVYLGEASRPDRVPLAPVICNSNHGYGSDGLIFEPRPCYHGSFLDQGTAVLDQSLPSLFGISAEFSDTTQLGGCTMTIRLRPGRPPANAPYTQEQILAASLQCVLFRATGVPESAPFTVVIQGEGMPTPDWAAKYAKPYFSEEIPDSTDRKPIVLPGLRNITDHHGVGYIIFEGVPENPKIPERGPTFVPFQNEGESGGDDDTPLIPVWPGDTWRDPLNVIPIPYLPYFERWHGSLSGRTNESVSVPHLTPPNPITRRWNLEVDRSNQRVDVSLRQTQLSPKDLAVFIFACVATELPTPQKPLKISLDNVAIPEDYQALLQQDPSWTDGSSCEFVIDPTTLALTKGSVPGFALIKGWGGVGYIVTQSQSPLIPEDSAPPWLAEALDYIRKEAPAVTQDELTEIKKHPDSLWKTTPVDRNRIIRSMLVLWKYDSSSTTLENMWFASNDRVIRTLSANLGGNKRPTTSDSKETRLNYESECLRFNDLEAQQRSEETSQRVQQLVHAAVKEWSERVAVSGEKE
jgi:hypothetical protein